ncbi:hypothetical protein HOY82DRAFT_595646 [Tuber indicum]|nr:hypothetical protein HOY82DRAFT_595646 [Tuber indicum]
MPQIKQLRKDEMEALLQAAIKFDYESSEVSIKGTVEKYVVAYSTLRGRLKGAESRVRGHRGMEALDLTLSISLPSIGSQADFSYRSLEGSCK